MQRRHVLIGLPLALAGCAAESVWAPEEEVRAAFYRDPGGPLLTLFTMKSTESDNGAHTGLMVSASQRVIFDPAGTFSYPTLPERNDVHFGITPRFEDFYISYHARSTYYVLRQDIPVSAEGAEIALQGVLNYGPVPKAACTSATARVMKRVPGLESITVTLFPDTLSRQVSRLPGVTSEVFRESDSDDKGEALRAFMTSNGQ